MHKFNVGGSWRLAQYDLGLGARLRYTGAFPMNSGVYVGDVDAYTSLDLRSRYDLPFAEGLHLLVSVDNVLGTSYRAFVGAPELGRLAPRPARGRVLREDRFSRPRGPTGPVGGGGQRSARVDRPRASWSPAGKFRPARVRRRASSAAVRPKRVQLTVGAR